MQIIECEEREGALLAALVDVWERSVRATHTFLSEQEILAIREFVPQALSGVETPLARRIDSSLFILSVAVRKAGNFHCLYPKGTRER